MTDASTHSVQTEFHVVSAAGKAWGSIFRDGGKLLQLYGLWFLAWEFSSFLNGLTSVTGPDWAPLLFFVISIVVNMVGMAAATIGWVRY